MTLPDDFEVVESGTHRIISEQQLKIQHVKALLRIIIATYGPSTAAHKHAQEALTKLNEGEQ